MELWHNPRCSKSRQARVLLDARGADYTERRYLEDPPTERELDGVLTALAREPWEIARMNEPVAKDLGLESVPQERERRLAILAASGSALSTVAFRLDLA